MDRLDALLQGINALASSTGQQRSAWLERQLEPVADAARYYAGPELSRFGAGVGNALAMISPGQDFVDAAQGSAEIMNADSPRNALAGAAKMGIGIAGQIPGFGDAFALAGKAALPAIFAGVGARTADMGQLARAENMLRDGASREDVLKETGWFWGADGKPRFEIDDSASRVTEGVYDDIKSSGAHSGDYRTALDHADAYSAYPGLAETSMTMHAKATQGGSYTPSANSVEVFGPGTGSQRSVALHEGQHVVQRQEGFASGGSPGMYNMMLPRVAQEARVIQRLAAKNGGDIEAAGKEWAQRYGNGKDPSYATMDAAKNFDESRLLEFSDPTAAYRRLAGEVEARNVQARRNMTASERRATPPWATQDVPDSAQIVRPSRPFSGDPELDAALRYIRGGD